MNRTGVLVYGDERIPYQVNEVSTRANRIAIHVEPDGSVIVDTPPNQTEKRVAQAIQRRARWISDHVRDAQDRFRHVMPREYVSGEQIIYLGRRYVLKVVQENGNVGTVRLKGNRLEVRHANPTRAKVKVLVRLWYRKRAHDYLSNRLGVLSTSLPWVSVPPPMRLLEMTRQWGSCTPEGEIILNPHLVKAPRDGIDYVLLHELAHLRHHDHGTEFRKLLARHCPGWEATKRQLDAMVEQLAAE